MAAARAALPATMSCTAPCNHGMFVVQGLALPALPTVSKEALASSSALRAAMWPLL